MLQRKKILASLILTAIIFSSAASSVKANDREYDAVVRHLKMKYRAKKVNIPFMWVARFAVKIARPAGVKSFNVTLFDHLNFSRSTLDAEMQSAMRNSLSPDWLPIFRIRSREGQQVYMYMREADKNVKLMLVTIDKENAAVIRAKFSPDKLAEFINNPRIFGISLGDDDKSNSHKPENNDQPPAKES